MSEVTLESKVLDFIQRHGLISPGEVVVVGVSGGADSVCLLHLLAKWRKELGMKLHVGHLNHQLRGAESEADAEYVSNLADSLAIPITVDRQEVAIYRAERNCSIEEAARELRYAFLARVATRVGASRIAVGHTRDDQVETILMHILRGTGTTGLRGLQPCSPIPSPSCQLLVIRPLLDVTRGETIGYCQEHQLAPRIDSSNLSLSFFRNRLRLQLLPLLRQYNPGVEQALLRLADIAKEDNAFIERQAFELWDAMARQENDAIYLDRKQIAGLPIALQRQLLRAAMAKLAGDARDIEAIHIEAVRGLLDKAVGKRISLPHGLICQKGYDELVLASEAWQSRLPPCPFPPLSGEIPLKVPGETDFAGWKAIASIVPKQADGGHCRPQLLGAWQPVEIAASPRFVGARGNDRGESHSDHERSKGEESRLPQGKLCQALVADCDLGKTGIKLFVRHRQPGDRFQPLGMDMPKKLREFMVDTKIPRCWRGHVPIVCSPQQIIWVVGWRIDDRVKVTEASEEILRLEFVRTE